MKEYSVVIMFCIQGEIFMDRLFSLEENKTN